MQGSIITAGDLLPLTPEGLFQQPKVIPGSTMRSSAEGQPACLWVR